jgi:hypothetical protein
MGGEAIEGIGTSCTERAGDQIAIVNYGATTAFWSDGRLVATVASFATNSSKSSASSTASSIATPTTAANSTDDSCNDTSATTSTVWCWPVFLRATQPSANRSIWFTAIFCPSPVYATSKFQFHANATAECTSAKTSSSAAAFEPRVIVAASSTTVVRASKFPTAESVRSCTIAPTVDGSPLCFCYPGPTWSQHE